MKIHIYPKTKISPIQTNNSKISFKKALDVDVFEKTTKTNSLFYYLSSLNNVVRYVDENVTAGETLASRDSGFFRHLSDLGVKTIVDLREFDEKYQKNAKTVEWNTFQYL